MPSFQLIHYVNPINADDVRLYINSLNSKVWLCERPLQQRFLDAGYGNICWHSEANTRPSRDWSAAQRKRVYSDERLARKACRALKIDIHKDQFEKALLLAIQP
jgi:hypothetical protein